MHDQGFALVCLVLGGSAVFGIVLGTALSTVLGYYYACQRKKLLN